MNRVKRNFQIFQHGAIIISPSCQCARALYTLFNVCTNISYAANVVLNWSTHTTLVTKESRLRNVRLDRDLSLSVWHLTNKSKYVTRVILIRQLQTNSIEVISRIYVLVYFCEPPYNTKILRSTFQITRYTSYKHIEVNSGLFYIVYTHQRFAWVISTSSSFPLILKTRCIWHGQAYVQRYVINN